MTTPDPDFLYNQTRTLLRHGSVKILVDTSKPNVFIPEYLLAQEQVVLEIGYSMKIPIPDLSLDDEGITCTLSFNRQPFFCSLPWESILAVGPAAPNPKPGTDSKPTPHKKKLPPYLRVVK